MLKLKPYISFILLLFLSLILMAGCKSVRPLVLEREKTIIRPEYKTDTVFVRKNVRDTLLVERAKVKVETVFSNDTVYQSVILPSDTVIIRDTVPVLQQVTNTGEKSVSLFRIIVVALAFILIVFVFKNQKNT